MHLKTVTVRLKRHASLALGISPTLTAIYWHIYGAVGYNFVSKLHDLQVYENMTYLYKMIFGMLRGIQLINCFAEVVWYQSVCWEKNWYNFHFLHHSNGISLYLLIVYAIGLLCFHTIVMSVRLKIIIITITIIIIFYNIRVSFLHVLRRSISIA
jgi:hypothetical protein